VSLAVKIALGIVLAATILAVLTTRLIRVRSRRRLDSVSAGKDVYLGLREQILKLSRDKCGLPATAGPIEPCAVLMDWGVSSGTATVVAVADGTVSIYLRSGGGSIGGGQSRGAIREAGRKFLSLASESLSKMQETTEYPLPGKGQVYFYVRTDAGVFTARTSQEELNSPSHALRALGDAAQEIITQYRQTQPAGRLRRQ
jgi:hypothetical protein